MKEFAKTFFGAVIFAVLVWVVVIYGTSDTVWNAGEHTAGCDGVGNCDCWEVMR
jgi:hypothetical protein